MYDMDNTPPSGPIPGCGGPFPPPFSETAGQERVEFTDEQKREVASAFHEAEVALLRAIARSADHPDTNYAARATGRLTHALATLRVAGGQAQGRSPFFPGPPPWAMGPEGIEEFGGP